MNPEVHAAELFFAEHWARYRWAAQLAAGKQVVDIACGTGYGCALLAEAGATTVVGMDASAETIAEAAAKYRSDRAISFLVSDAAAFPFKSAAYDMVVSFETIEHLPDPERFVAEAARVVRASGSLLVSTPNPRAYAAGNPYHINELSPSGYEQLLRSYFAYVELYYQSDWLCSAIFESDELERLSRDKSIGGDMFKVSAMPRLECAYVLAICSHEPISRAANPVGVLIRDQQTQIDYSRQLQRTVRRGNDLIVAQQQRLQQLTEELARVARNNERLVDSVRKLSDNYSLRRGESQDLPIASYRPQQVEIAPTAGLADYQQEREQNSQLCREILTAIETYRNRFRADLETYRNQRPWQVMLMLRKAHTLLFGRGWSGRMEFFRWALTLPWNKDWGLAEYDLSFPDIGQDMPKGLWQKAISFPSSHPATSPPPAYSAPRHKYDLIVLPVFEFDFRYQRPQQLVSQFARAGHRVFWVSPSRIAKQRSAGYEAIRLQPNVWEVRLSHGIPNLYRGKWDDAGLATITRSLNQLFQDREILESAVILQLPFWRQVGAQLKRDHNTKVVYDCIDQWDTFPQVGPFTRGEEPKLAAEADVLVVTAKVLFEKHAKRGLAPILVRNGADFDFFRSPGEGADLSDIPKPIIGYFGAIADWFDFDLMRRAALERPHYSFVLIGSLALEEKAVGKEISKLSELPNVHLLGHKSYNTIPSYLKNFDVCVIPFRLNEVTMATDPVKLYEYLSQGKPVVTTAMGELEAFSDLVYIARNPEEFILHLDTAVKEPAGSIQTKRIKFAEANSWETRYHAMDSAISSSFPLVSILIVCYNSANFIGLCLDSIFRNTSYPSFEIIVVDNASTDGTPEVLNEYARREPRIKVTPLTVNEGFACGNNRAAREAQGDYLVLLNADTMVTAGWIGRLLTALTRNPNAGLAGPVTNCAGNEMRINVTYSNVREMEEFARDLARSHRGEVTDVAVAPLFCTLVSKSVWQSVGELDGAFGIGMFEDDDYSLRIRQAGLRVLCVEDCFVHHFGQGSFRQMDPAAYGRLFESNKRQFEKKSGAPWTAHRYRASVSGQGRQFVPSEFCQSDLQVPGANRPTVL